jgi:penicillin-binding protein 2
MLAVLFSTGFAGIAAKLYDVQVVNVAEFKRDLTIQATRRVRKPGIRGRILDSKGGVLAESRARRDIVCDLAAFRKNGSLSNTVVAVEREVVRLACALGVDRPEDLTPRRIVRHIRTASAIPMCVWRDLDESTLARFEERAAAFAGFSVESHAERHYPRGSFAAHLIGYTGRDRDTSDPEEAYMLAYELEMKGRSGLEKYYNDYLAGVSGTVRIPVDARGFKPLE